MSAELPWSIAEIGLSSVEPQQPPSIVGGPDAERPLNRSVVDRVRATLRRVMDRDELPDIPPLCSEEVDRSCAPWGLLAEENQAVWKLLDHRRLNPERGAGSSYQRMTDFRASPTDPDAALMNDGRRPALGYHDHYVVDGGKDRIILSALVTPAASAGAIPEEAAGRS